MSTRLTRHVPVTIKEEKTTVPKFDRLTAETVRYRQYERIKLANLEGL